MEMGEKARARFQPNSGRNEVRQGLSHLFPSAAVAGVAEHACKASEIRV